MRKQQPRCNFLTAPPDNSTTVTREIKQPHGLPRTKRKPSNCRPQQTPTLKIPHVQMLQSRWSKRLALKALPSGKLHGRPRHVAFELDAPCSLFNPARCDCVPNRRRAVTKKFIKWQTNNSCERTQPTTTRPRSASPRMVFTHLALYAERE